MYRKRIIMFSVWMMHSTTSITAKLSRTEAVDPVLTLGENLSCTPMLCSPRLIPAASPHRLLKWSVSSWADDHTFRGCLFELHCTSPCTEHPRGDKTTGIQHMHVISYSHTSQSALSLNLFKASITIWFHLQILMVCTWEASCEGKSNAYQLPEMFFSPLKTVTRAEIFPTFIQCSV